MNGTLNTTDSALSRLKSRKCENDQKIQAKIQKSCRLHVI